MKMFRFLGWCEKATSSIGFPGDRKKVQQELYDHMMDRYETLLQQGMESKEAQMRVVEAMGDPFEIAPMLGAIHRPFWGYFLKVTRVLLVILLCISLIPIGKYLLQLRLSEASRLDFEVFSEDSYGGATGRTLHTLAEGSSSFRESGYTFSLTDAAMWSEADSSYLYFQVTQIGFLPVSEAWEYDTYWSFSAGARFWVEDSAGNHFTVWDSSDAEGDPTLLVRGYQTGVFSCKYEFLIKDLPDTDIQWIGVHYNRDGRDHVIYINLTGGDAV